MKRTFRYNSIFTYGSLQTVGHTMEYFIKHTRKLVIFIVMPRINGVDNLVRRYEKGRLIEEKRVSSSKNIFLYYLQWWFYHNKLLLSYFSPEEKVLVFAGHPIAFFGMSIMKRLRRATYAYWIGDYFPPVHWSLMLFEKVKKFYHDRIPYTYYLSDSINKLFNGSAVTKSNKRTVMWGVRPYTKAKTAPHGSFRLLFVGVIRPSQGLEEIFEFLKNASDVRLSIVGVCEKKLYANYMAQIRKLGITKQVWFPNKFMSDEKLKRLGDKHDVGIALYETGLHTATHYTDPGKVKTYIEMGLPVVMTDTSAVAPYIRKYKAGEVVERASDLSHTLRKIKAQYNRYLMGVAAFANYFNYERYYHRSFTALEEVR